MELNEVKKNSPSHFPEVAITDTSMGIFTERKSSC